MKVNTRRYLMRLPNLIYLLSTFFLPQLSIANKPLVVSTASIFADMAENIAGEEVEVEMIVPIGGDPHLYEPTPADVQLVERADLIIMNGLTFEGWLNELIENSGTKARVVQITKGIEPIQSLAYTNSTDPHAWMDAHYGMIYIENIKNALTELIPRSAKVFEFNFGIYRQQMEELDQFIKRAITQIPPKQRILITSHDAFRYYGNRYGIKVESVLGTSTDADIQISDINRLSKIIEQFDIPAVFIETTVNPKVLEQLAKDKGIKIGGKLFSDSIGSKDSNAPSYIDMLKYNTTTIVSALLETQKIPLESTTIVQDAQKDLEKKTVFPYLLVGLIALILVGGFWVLMKNVVS